jgi:hypothetical protein
MALYSRELNKKRNSTRIEPCFTNWSLANEFVPWITRFEQVASQSKVRDNTQVMPLELVLNFTTAVSLSCCSSIATPENQARSNINPMA